MNYNLINILACPACKSQLKINEASVDSLERIVSGKLVCEDCKQIFPVVDSIPRFVPPENYAGNFGFQWKKFRATQLDSHSGLDITKDRFYKQSGWTPEELKGKRVLDIGCGAGRFAEIALASGAHVVAVDFSSAVEACFLNHGKQSDIDVLQADIYNLPFRPESFDYVYCFGVLQHTPDVEKAFMSLPRQLKEGGKLAVDVYRKHWSNSIHPKYLLRPITTRIKAKSLFGLIEKWVPRILPVSNIISGIPVIGKYLSRLLPVVNYRGLFPLSEKQLIEWSILDTFDWYGPAYDQPQTEETLDAWFHKAGLTEIEILHPAHLTGRGIKPLFAVSAR